MEHLRPRSSTAQRGRWIALSELEGYPQNIGRETEGAFGIALPLRRYFGGRMAKVMPATVSGLVAVPQ